MRLLTDEELLFVAGSGPLATSLYNTAIAVPPANSDSAITAETNAFINNYFGVGHGPTSGPAYTDIYDTFAASAAGMGAAEVKANANAAATANGGDGGAGNGGDGDGGDGDGGDGDGGDGDGGDGDGGDGGDGCF